MKQTLCNFCGEKVTMLPPDLVDYCKTCTIIVEGYTRTTAEQEIAEQNKQASQSKTNWWDFACFPMK